MSLRRSLLAVPFTLLLALVVALSLPTYPVPADDTTPDPAATTDSGDKEANPKPQRDDEYYELLELFADTLDQIERNYVKDLSRRELMEAAIDGMLSKLDQYSNYISPEDLERFNTSVESEFGGIGIQVSIDGGQLNVISPIVGSPAYKAGLVAGDKIVEIEGETTKDITLDEAVKRIKGKIGSKVNLTIERADGKKEVVAVERAIVRVSTVLGDTRKDDDSWNFFLNDDQKIAYVRMTSFSRHTTGELREAMEELKKAGMKGLVLDLRFNPGGLLSSAIQVCDLFVSDGVIVSTAGRNIDKKTWNAHKAGTLEDFPMAVIVNHYSASASEIVSACLQDHKRAIVVGERTWGKGSVQNIIQLEGGKSALKLTTAGYQRPSGKNIHRDDDASNSDEWGVTPNDGFEVKMSGEQQTAYLRYRRDRDIVKEADPNEQGATFDDTQLKKALEYVEQQLAMAEKKDEEKKDEAKEGDTKTEEAKEASGQE